MLCLSSIRLWICWLQDAAPEHAPIKDTGWIDCLDEMWLFYALLRFSVFCKFVFFDSIANVMFLFLCKWMLVVQHVSPDWLDFLRVSTIASIAFWCFFVAMEAWDAAFWMDPKSRALQRFVETCSVKICQRLSFSSAIYLQVAGGREARGERRESGGRRCAWGKDATRGGNNGSRECRDARGLIAFLWLPITSTYIGDLWV